MTKILSCDLAIDAGVIDPDTKYVFLPFYMMYMLIVLSRKLYEDILYGLLMDGVAFRNVLAAAGVGNTTLEVCNAFPLQPKPKLMYINARISRN